MKNLLINSILVLMLLSFTVISLVNADETLKWAGCGISKKAFMSEMSKAYTKKTGVKVDLSGGGATKGIRNAAFIVLSGW